MTLTKFAMPFEQFNWLNYWSWRLWGYGVLYSIANSRQYLFNSLVIQNIPYWSDIELLKELDNVFVAEKDQLKVLSRWKIWKACTCWNAYYQKQQEIIFQTGRSCSGFTFLFNLMKNEDKQFYGELLVEVGVHIGVSPWFVCRSTLPSVEITYSERWSHRYHAYSHW